MADHVLPRSRWHPSPLLRASAALHLAALAGAAAVPAAWPWALGVVAGNHALLGAAGLWPRSTLLGPNLRRLPERNARLGQVGLCFDDGPDPEVTPAVLEMLARAGATASFFCIAERAERHPDLIGAITRCGHTVENHSWHHSHRFAAMGAGSIRREVGTAQHILTGLAGRPPRFFKAPAGLRNPLLDPVLSGFGLRLASWTRRGFDAVRRNPVEVERRLVRALAAGDILMLHDGSAARSPHGQPVVLQVLPRLLDRLADQGLAAVSLEVVADD
ncbi:polysaccharide deacetylase family protein [Azospirillum picis]|uniref:Chitooligosaccharide deacetylase n=1 Tax=Azospirillum picis TaxID=488438 RepID=A0ABU0MQC6_9PROT|nr:polysaccharide deacetylase family protein [Azospirillum picis]MBP2302032.1 peptidoglycan/xylan/chitin deacetylase (PgdA/CDA1 family) [Azospirillum picis]MDQ0535677.1 peptidoglycan/xylan/chitin deacetylase (PgdA/CDA1 family) [Azospirillum picis]